MTKSEKAVELFERYNCAQSVFAACGPAEGLSEETCLKLAAPFGGGMGRMGEACGAVTGALMTLGLRHGQDMVTKPVEARGPMYSRVAAFADEFKAQHGALTCRELTGCDMRTPEGMADMKARDLHHTLCRKLVASAAEMLDKK